MAISKSSAVGSLFVFLVGLVAASDFITQIVTSLKFGTFELLAPSTILLLNLAASIGVVSLYGAVPLRTVPRLIATLAAVVLFFLLSAAMAFPYVGGLVALHKPYAALSLATALSALACAAYVGVNRSTSAKSIRGITSATCAAAVLLWLFGAAVVAV